MLLRQRVHYGHSQFIILDLFTSDRVYLSGCLAAFNFEELNVFLLIEKLLVYTICIYTVCIYVCVCVCVYIYIYIYMCVCVCIYTHTQVYRSLLGYFLESV